MKRKTALICTIALTVSLLAAVPLSVHAVSVKSSNGQAAVSAEAESEERGGPVPGDQVADGSYDITVDSSSSMFRVTACTLTASGGEMTARMTLSGTAYLKLYMGTDSEAAEADESDCIPFEENPDGSYSYTVPVEALNREIDCAAFSSHSNKWFPRTLVFEASSLPDGAVKESALTADSPNDTDEKDRTTVDGKSQSAGKAAYEEAASVKESDINYEAVSLADGKYTIPVTLTGGSGKASIGSPAEMTVENSHATARIQWSSPNYDYMVIDELLYEPVNEDGNSVFEIPVTKFGGDMKVIADTTAMSQPHEIEYTLDFDLDKAERQGLSTKTKGVILLIIILLVIIAGFIRGRLRSGKVRYDAAVEEAEYERLSSQNQKPVSKKKKKLK
ncbi:MAG: hypothetical protein IKD86_06580 [Firmicutes bacterium]|nr:hypothetical protein [Bacillota bacterium]